MVGGNAGLMPSQTSSAGPGKPAWVAWQVLSEGEVGSDAFLAPTGPALGCVLSLFSGKTCAWPLLCSPGF